MPAAQSRAEAVWEGNLTEGGGEVSFASGVVENLPISWGRRVERTQGATSPEEMIAAAHAACYAMAFSNTLATAGHNPEHLDVTATCSFEYGSGGAKITTMELTVRGRVPGLDQAAFEELARKGEQGCPVSNALRNNVDIHVNAEIESGVGA